MLKTLLNTEMPSKFFRNVYAPGTVYSPYDQIVTLIFSKTVTIWRIFEFSIVFRWQFLKISQKIAKRNDLMCNVLVLGTVILFEFFCWYLWWEGVNSCVFYTWFFGDYSCVFKLMCIWIFMNCIQIHMNFK